MRVLFALLFLLLGVSCHNKTAVSKSKADKTTSTCYKARLAIKGICMNYVIQVLDGDTSRLALEKEWKDETDGKVYRNVFALGSRCTFPDLVEGAEFYFTLDDGPPTQCNVCLAYRAVPAAKNNIVVHQTACP